MRTVYLNGEFVPEADAKLSIYDLSVMQAAAAFEMTRSFGGKHFKLREHLKRLEQSCKLLGIPLPTLEEQEQDFSFVEQVENICAEISDRNDHGPGEEHRLLIVVSPGCAPMYRDLAGVIPHPFLYIADFPLRYTVKGLGRQFINGGTAICSHVQQIPDECIPSAAKHRSRATFHLAQVEAAKKNADWAIMLDRWRYVTECPGANMFILHRGVLISPTYNCLQGISQQTVFELAEQCGIKTIKERSISQDLFFSGEISEVFVTGTPFCAIPIVEVDGFRVGSGKPGPVYKRILDAWSESVGVQIDKQIIDWDACSTA